jgi:uncharacterized protein (DUF1778 family)
VETTTASVQSSANDTIETRSGKDSRLNLRVTPRQDQLIRRAAAALDKSVTDFVIDSVGLEAERVLAEQRWFMLPDAEWDLFHKLLDRPIPTDDAKLREMLTVRREINLSDL